VTVELIEIEPGRWRVKRPPLEPARSDLPMPHVISDIMPPTEQVDGRFYTSKSAFRKVGRSLGLTEVGNEKPKPRVRLSQTRAAAEARRASIKKAVEMVRAGNINHKSRSNRP
jgi:hypothetical protein